MCYNLSQHRKTSQEQTNYYQGLLPLKPENVEEGKLHTNPHYFVSGFEHPELLIITERGLGCSEWGLIPSWAKTAQQAVDIQPKTLNARSETAFEKPSFKQSIFSQRCLIGVDGFFEWRTFDKTKYPYFIYTQQDELLTLGGIYSLWVDQTTGEQRSTFSIITTEANAVMGNIHNTKKRMPLIFEEQEQMRLWLSSSTPKQEVVELMKPCDSAYLEAHTVGRWVNQAKNDRNRKEALQAVTYPELALLPIR